MRRSATLPELLSPAGSYEALLAAIEAGADAVYLGGKVFNARAYAANFDEATLSRAIQYAHLNGVKVYVTLNTLLFDRELTAFLEYAETVYKLGADAVIVADLGAISALRRALPHLEIHASTQASVHSTKGADELYNLGVYRTVLARELSFENIRSVTEHSLAETEVFLHGALCVCHSGQCLFSSLVGERSGNRGECAQPCRLPYSNGYPLSLKDLSLCSHIPELISSGVASLKIEGRMKSPEYVYTVTKIYRRLLDENRNATKAEQEELAAVFSRGGFTDGYFTKKTENAMKGVRSESDKEKTRLLDEMTFKERKLPIKAKCKLKATIPTELALFYNDTEIAVSGTVPQTAISSPLTEESVKANICKMGNTFFSLEKDDIELELDEGLNMPVSALNALRRSASEALLCKLTARKQKTFPYSNGEKSDKPVSNKTYSALCFLRSQFEAICKLNFFDTIYLPLTEIEEGKSLPDGVYLPPVITDEQRPEVLLMMKNAKKLGVKYALVGNISHFSLAKEADLIPRGDFRLNITNNESLNAYKELGAEGFILSPELSLPKIRDIREGYPIVYGRIPLMLLERCYMKENFGCKKCGKCELTDRKGIKFPLIREYKHRNLLLNSSVTYMGDKKGLLAQYNIRGGHFIFTTENEAECKRAVLAYKNGEALPCKSIRRIPK